MTVLLQVSDTHFGTEQAPVVDALVRFAHAQRPGLLLLSGDITQRARRAQFRAARRFVDRLAIPVELAIPGNHDVPLFNLPVRLFAPYANHRRAFGPELEPAFESERLLVLTLNTTRRWRHKHGEVSTQQIERVARRLERASPAQLRVVAAHQPVCVPGPEDENNLLRGHAHAVRRWAESGADLILGGHIHLPFVCPLHERVRGLARPVWVVQAGTAVSRRVRAGAPNSVNLLRLAPAAAVRRCAVERWDYDARHEGFRLVDAQELCFDAG